MTASSGHSWTGGPPKWKINTAPTPSLFSKEAPDDLLFKRFKTRPHMKIRQLMITQLALWPTSKMRSCRSWRRPLNLLSLERTTEFLELSLLEALILQLPEPCIKLDGCQRWSTCSKYRCFSHTSSWQHASIDHYENFPSSFQVSMLKRG